MRRWLGWAALATLAACGGAAGTLGQTSDHDAGSLDGASSGDGSASADGSGGDSASGGGDGGVDDAAAADGAIEDGSFDDGAASDAGLASDGAGALGDARLDAPSDARTDGAADASVDSGIGPCGVGVVNGIVEIEPNGTLATATPMPAAVNAPGGATRSVCGTATSVADLDFIRFQVKPTASGLKWNWFTDSLVNITPVFYVGGAPFPLDDAGAQLITLQSAEPYVVEIRPNPGTTFPMTWRFTVEEN